jgi:hypothetical protein
MATKKTATPTTPTVIPPRAEVDEFIGESKKDIDASLATIRKLSIKKPAELEFAGSALKEVAHRHDVIDKKRKSWVEPLKAVAKDIDKTFKPLLDGLKAAEQILKDKIGEYHVAGELARAALLKDASKAIQSGNQGAAEAALAQADKFVPSVVEGVTATTYWTGEVIDAAAIPREYLMPDVAKLEAMTKATGEDPKIPGWRAFPTSAVRTSRKGNE